MRTHCLRIVVIGLVLACGGTVRANEAPSTPPLYHPPEHFTAQHRSADYLPHAKQFLAEHPTDPRGARVALDMLMVSSLTGQQAEIKAAKLHLLLYHSDSLPAGYLVKSSQAKDIAALLKERFNDSAAALDRLTLKRFLLAVNLAQRIYGPTFFDDELWAQSAIAAQDARVSLALQTQIKNKEGDAFKTVAVMLDSQLNLREKFVALQSLRSYATARSLQRFLFSELTDEERVDSAVREVVVENLLHEHKFAGALPILSELCGTAPEPRTLFWYGWAQSANGDFKAAQATFAKLQQDHSSDAWSRVADNMAKDLDHVCAACESHATIFDDVYAQLMAAAPAIVQAKVEWQAGDKSFAIETLMDLDADAFEFITSKNDAALLAYAADASGCRYFLHGDETIHHFTTRGLCPVFSLLFNQKPGGGFNGNFNFNTATQGSGSLKKSVYELLKQPSLALRDNRLACLGHAIKSGFIPLHATEADGVRTLRWIYPKVDSPALLHFDICVDKADRITAVRTDNFSLHEIYYGPRIDRKLGLAGWPKLRVEQAAEFGSADFVRLFGAVVSIATGDSTQSADVAKRSRDAAR